MPRNQNLKPQTTPVTGFLHQQVQDLTKSPTALVTETNLWYSVAFGGHIPPQGWKLHLSSDEAGLKVLTKMAVPYLIKRKTDFKVIKSAKALNELATYAEQLGKAITIYPKSDKDAVEVARELDHILADLEGPKIPTDRRLHDNSIVHYRYGSITRFKNDKSGNLVGTLVNESAQETIDRKMLRYVPPRLRTDPFIENNLATPLQPTRSRLGSRYRVTHYRYTAPKLILVARDKSNSESEVVIKKVPRLLTFNGIPVASLIEHEFSILGELNGRWGSPIGIELFDDEESLCLVEKKLKAQSLSSYIRDSYFSGDTLTDKQCVALISRSLKMIARFHAAELVLGDISPGNIVVSSNGRVGMVDFEFTHRLGEPWYNATTYGFRPQQKNFENRSPFSFDNYAAAGLIFFICTGKLPYIPNGWLIHEERIRKLLRLIRPSIAVPILELVKKRWRQAGWKSQ